LISLEFVSQNTRKRSLDHKSKFSQDQASAAQAAADRKKTREDSEQKTTEAQVKMAISSEKSATAMDTMANGFMLISQSFATPPVLPAQVNTLQMPLSAFATEVQKAAMKICKDLELTQSKEMKSLAAKILSKLARKDAEELNEIDLATAYCILRHNLLSDSLALSDNPNSVARIKNTSCSFEEYVFAPCAFPFFSPK
jgi:hypothetical protein